MAIQSLADLQVFQDAIRAADAVSAIMRGPAFTRESSLRQQLGQASAAVAAHIGEGFGQLTDRHFAHYLAIGRGSCNEVQAHLATAYARRCITEPQWRELTERYAGLGKRLTRLIQYLRREDRKERG